ncbi:MAG TPA: D-hexose-6-phosphate mutarotase [Verrucomicrobiae bacterium]|nr:D-hexose-6-phosphate mutarotase [Verrucomicrobiae bacterium]
MARLPNSVRMDAGRGGLQRLLVETPAAEAEIYLHGAHVTQFQPRGQKPVLFMSEKSSFEAGKPIRGGVPIIFPWFGARSDGRTGPAHGFARLMQWELVSAKQGDDGTVGIMLRLVSNAATRKEWDGEFEIEYRVAIGRVLGLVLSVKNAGSQLMRIEEALHTYLAVSDVKKVSVEGLAGVTYADRVGAPQTKTEGAAPIRVTAETDRIYMNTQSTCVVDDPGWKRRLIVEKAGSNATVVWNPWIAKAKAMPDFGDDEWPGMLCIETCNVQQCAVTLAPGESHTMIATIRVG